MKILHLSDIHGRVENFQFIEDLLQNSDLIIISGDLTHMGREDAMANTLRFLPLDKTLALLGNCDYPSTLKTLRQANISIDGECTEVAGYKICGYGGSLPTPIDTPNMHPEEEFLHVLDTFSDVDILVTHQPPYGTKADLLPTGKHVGSKSITEYIGTYQPKLALCGHMHEAQSVSKIGETFVVNSGSLALGNYALINLTDNKVDIELGNISS